MNPKEVQAAVAQALTEAKAAVLPWFEHPAPQRAWLPRDERWSIDEILHHITLTNHYLLILIDKAAEKSLKAKARGEQLDWPSDYALIPPALQDASKLQAFTWHRPDHMDPRLHPASGDVQELFLAQMQRCEAILGQLENGWGHWQKTTMSVNDLGKIDVYQFIVFLAQHALRHVAQMQANLDAMAIAQ
jgi:DinB superfamily